MWNIYRNLIATCILVQVVETTMNSSHTNLSHTYKLRLTLCFSNIYYIQWNTFAIFFPSFVGQNSLIVQNFTIFKIVWYLFWIKRFSKINWKNIYRGRWAGGWIVPTKLIYRGGLPPSAPTNGPLQMGAFSGAGRGEAPVQMDFQERLNCYIAPSQFIGTSAKLVHQIVHQKIGTLLQSFL